jgi:hypothetical protein
LIGIVSLQNAELLVREALALGMDDFFLESNPKSSKMLRTGWAFRDAQRELVETCERKIAALERLKQITEDCDLWTALDDPKVQEQIKDYLREQGLWPPKKQ